MVWNINRIDLYSGVNKKAMCGECMKRIVISLILFVTGLLLFLYPTVSNFINHYFYKTKVINYEHMVEKLEVDDVDKRFEKMEAYNQSLKGSIFYMEDPFAGDEKKKDSIVDFIGKDDVFGTIMIPKINEELPIYLGASQQNLSNGVGQIGRTSLPIGGEDTHTVLAGHRGYHGATMFRHLDRMQEGDNFYINVLGKQLTYRVIGREIINPDQVEKLAIIKGKDRATLLTCEPYTSSKYRLLIYGERVQDELIQSNTKRVLKIEQRQAQEFRNTWMFIIVGFCVICIGLYGFLKKK